MDESNLIDNSGLEYSFRMLSEAEKATLLNKYNVKELHDTIHKLKNSFQIAPKESLSFYNPHFYSGNLTDKYLGRFILSKNKVGALIVAGGQGTRLGYSGPKGSFPISVVNHKSLFQLFAEKIKYAGERVGVELPLAIMTSEANDEATKNFFAEHHYFGLNPSKVSFFCQGECPFLNHEGRIFLESKDRIASAPNGNGASLSCFYHSPIWKEWREKGIEYFLFLPIDNPLADPFDEELIGFHHRLQNDITLKATLRKDPQEKVGVIVKEKEKIEVIEYHEIKKYFSSSTSEELGAANLSLFCINFQFVERFIENGWAKMPLHVAEKKAQKAIKEDQEWKTVSCEAWKFEYYIFDILPFADHVEVLIFPREKVFAPLKNFSGEDSINTVKAALQAADLKAFYRISGITPSLECIDHPFELSQKFYYPTKDFLLKWKGQKLPDQFYIEG